MHYPSNYPSCSCKKILGNLFIRYSGIGLLKKKRKKRKKMNIDLNVIPVKLKVAINMDTPVQHIYAV